MLQWRSGTEEEMTLLQSRVEWSGHGEMVLKTGDRASEVSQNFGMSSREIHHAQNFSHRVGLGKPASNI